MSSDEEKFEITVKAGDGGMIDGDPWKYEARCERGDRLAEEVAKLRQEVEEANKVNAALHGKPLDGEAETFRKLWMEEKAAKEVEVDRAYRLRDEVSEVRAALQDREARLEALRGEREVLERQHAEEVEKFNAEAIEREACIQSMDARMQSLLEDGDAMEQRHRAELVKVARVEVEPFLLRIAEAERREAIAKEAARSLRQEVQDFLKGMNEETARANAAEGLLSMWEEAFDARHLMGPLGGSQEMDDDGEWVEVVPEWSRSMWTPEKWLHSINALAATLKDGAEDAERKINRSLTLGLEEQRRADRLQVELDMANKARAELEEILSAWEETFDVGRVWAPPGDDERDRGDWTVEEWRAAILATSEHLRAEEVKAQRSAALVRSLHTGTLEERDRLRHQLTEAEGAIRMLRVWCEEVVVERFKAEQALALHRIEQLPSALNK